MCPVTNSRMLKCLSRHFVIFVESHTEDTEVSYESISSSEVRLYRQDYYLQTSNVTSVFLIRTKQDLNIVLHRQLLILFCSDVIKNVRKYLYHVPNMNREQENTHAK
jgi:hypothetical protein